MTGAAADGEATGEILHLLMRERESKRESKREKPEGEFVKSGLFK